MLAGPPSDDVGPQCAAVCRVERLIVCAAELE